MFVGRESELKQLNNLYIEETFQLAIVYGRRRVGKTRLLMEFCKGKQSLFFVAEEHNNRLALQKFSRLVFEFFGINSTLMPMFETWEQALLFISEKSKDKQIVIVFDEFPYMVSGEKSLPSLLQNLIDHKLKDTKLFLILCGSSMNFIENSILSYKSPLYGRMNGQFLIKPFDFFDAREFLANYTIEEQIISYAILGGIPQYLLKFNDQKSIEANIKKKILLKSSYLNNEPFNLLKQELREPVFYNSVIESIASGATKLNQIATKVGESTAKVSRYLDILIELSIIEKLKPYGEKEKSRKTIYRIIDPLFDFFYRFIFPNSSLIEQEMGDEVYDSFIKPGLETYVGKQFENICIEYLLRLNKGGKLPVLIHNYGSWWGNNPMKKCVEEIDIVAGNKDKVILAECKWRKEETGKSVLDKLIERSQLINVKDKYYILFSKSGFKDSVKKHSIKKVAYVNLEMISKTDINFSY